MSMKHFLPLLLSVSLVPGAFAQTTLNVTGGPAVATAGNLQAQNQSGGNITKPSTPAKPPAKPPTKPPTKGTPPPSKPPTPPAPSLKPSNNQTSSQQQQMSSSSANANSNTNVAAGGAGGAGGASTATGGKATGGSAAGGAGGVGVGGTGTGGSSSAANNGSTTSSSTIDAGDHSVSNTSVKVNYIPAVIPETPPSFLAVGNVAVESSGCGPLQQVHHSPVDGTFFGLIKKSKVPQGFTDDLEPYTNAEGELQSYYRESDGAGGTILLGHQVTQYTAILGVSGAKNIALGGGSGSGAWGQGGVGASSSNQQLVTKIVLRLCEAGRIPAPASTVTFSYNPEAEFDSNVVVTPALHDLPPTKKIRQ